MTLGTGITILCLITFFLGILFDVWLRNDKAKKEPPRVVESDSEYIKRVLAWEELDVSSEQAQRESAP